MAIIIRMDIELEPGKYIVAVSGGVDSVSLLHALASLPEYDLVVAHFDHGIRNDSAEDRRFVEQLAKHYKLPFIYEEGQLGPDASEAEAREARYEFLRRARDEQQATAIVTAHHHDDALETAVINLLRGTGRKGLSALGSQSDVARPLLNASKDDILEFARRHQLQWREDPSNRSDTYLRNYVRRQLLPRFDERSKLELRNLIEQSKLTNQKLDRLLTAELQHYATGAGLDRYWFTRLPHDISKEMMAAWLRSQGVRSFDRRGLERLVVMAKVGRPGSRTDVMQGVIMKVDRNKLALERLER